MPNSEIARAREFLKDTFRQRLEISATDQNRGVPSPPLTKPCPPDARRFKLPGFAEIKDLGAMPLAKAIRDRRSRRKFKETPLKLVELAFLLWATQGMRDARRLPYFRSVPSAGARHAMETYLFVRCVEGLEEGIYHYLPFEHELALVRQARHLGGELMLGALGQSFVAAGAVAFIWTAVPYRAEWRYGIAAHKTIAMDAGHLCQNLYLACEAIGAGTCAVGAYDQARMDALLGVDGVDEFTIYLSPVGKI